MVTSGLTKTAARGGAGNLGATFELKVGFRVQGLGLRVQGSGFRVQGLGFRVQGLGNNER